MYIVIKTIDDQDYTDIYINNKRLVEILREFELQYDSDIAGLYRGLPTDVVFLPSRHLLDQV